MSPVQARKPVLQPKGPLIAGSSTKCREEKSRGARSRKSSSPPPAPSRLSRVLRARRQRRARSSQSSSSTESLSSRQTSPSPSASETASGASTASASTTDTTLITGGTTIWSCSSVTVNMSGANTAPESPADSATVPSPQMSTTNYTPETYETSCEVYRRHMALRKKGRHPLWIPQPNLQLPLEYRRRGTQVGDVGIITEDGAFDFMFNICTPATNPLDLPVGFQPIYPPIIPEKEVVVLAEHSARDALTSRGISKQVLPSGESVFTCTQPNGAILVLPDGAVTERLLNFTRFQQYYAQNAESWYTFARETRGPDVRNGDLHLVYGCDKATEWGMISFDNPHRGTQVAELRFRNMGEDWRDMVGTPYTWEHTDDAEGRVGPRDRETQELGGSRGQPFRNQTLFIQTVNTTLREEEWQRITGSVTMDVCMDPGASGSSSAASCPGSVSPMESPSNAGYSSQTQYHTTHNARMVPGAQRYLPSAPRMQPSKVLNEYLLSQYPEAKVAVTSSDIWSHVEDDCLESRDALVAAILAVYSPVLGVDGVVSFASDDHLDGTSEFLLPLEHLALVPYAYSEVQHEKHSGPSSHLSTFATLTHKRKYLQDSPTKLLSDRSPYHGESVRRLRIKAPKKRKRNKREMLLKQIRQKAEIIEMLFNGIESKPPELDMDSLKSLNNAEITSSEFEGASGTDTDSEGDLWHPYDLALEKRRYHPQPKMERPSPSIECAQKSNAHPDFSGVLDTSIDQHPSDSHPIPTQTPAPSIDLGPGSSLWHARTPMNGAFEQERPRDTFDIGDTENLCERTRPRYSGDQSRPH